MKTLLLSTALAAGFVLPAAAQTTPASPFQAEAAGPSVAASDMIGARVYASEAAVDADAYSGVQEGWEDIGEVNDVILGRDGSVDAVLVDIGGFLGMGERQVAVDMSALRIVQDDATDADDWFLVLQTDRATMEGAPEWTMPAQGMDTGAADDGNLDAESATEQAAESGTDGMENVPAVDEAIGDRAEVAPGTEPAPGTMEDPAAAETMTEAPLTEDEMALPEGYAAVEPTALTSELLTGADVRDASDASIAEVSDLVLTEDGQVTHVVLDVGGFLGIGAKSVALPMERLTVAQSNDSVRLWVDMTKEELEALPEHSM